MNCPKCNKDYGELITICPDCFIEIDQRSYTDRSKEHHQHKRRKITESVNSKSKGLLQSALSGLFGSKNKQEDVFLSQKRDKKNDMSKSGGGAYSTFSISTSSIPIFSLDNPPIPEIIIPDFRPESINIETGITSEKTSQSIMIEREIPEKASISSDSFVKTKGVQDIPDIQTTFSKPDMAPYKAPIAELKKNIETTISQKNEKATEHYEKGRNYEKQNKFKEALAEYGTAIVFKPDWAEPYYRAGLILARIKNYNEAYEKLKQVIKINPNNSEAYYQLGKISLQRNIKEDAEKYFKIALQNNPKLSAAKTELEKIYNKATGAIQVRCQNCGAFQPGRAKFCGNCGGKVK